MRGCAFPIAPNVIGEPLVRGMTHMKPFKFHKTFLKMLMGLKVWWNQ